MAVSSGCSGRVIFGTIAALVTLALILVGVFAVVAIFLLDSDDMSEPLEAIATAAESAEAARKDGASKFVATGNYHTCILQEADGHAVCWGRDDYGQSSKVPEGVTFNSPILNKTYTDNVHSEDSKDSKAICWGDNESLNETTKFVGIPPSDSKAPTRASHLTLSRRRSGGAYLRHSPRR